jgi:hypothetical protein
MGVSSGNAGTSSVGTPVSAAMGVICGDGAAGFGIFIVAHNTCGVGAGGFPTNASAGSVRINSPNTANIKHSSSNKRNENKVKEVLLIILYWRDETDRGSVPLACAVRIAE